jgi:hypothetical protein
VCGPIDPSYVRTSTETGGQLLIVGTDEIARATAAIDPAFENEPILWASAGGERTYSVPVDASIARVAFIAAFDGKGGRLAVASPDGSPPSGVGVSDTPLHCGRIVSVDAPAGGAWQVSLAPTGRFWLAVRVKSELSVDAEFVREGGRPGHEGLFEIDGHPVAGRPATLRVRLWPTPWGDTFSLVSLDGRVLQDVALHPVADDEFVGAVDLPPQAFRVAVRGIDERGMPSQRMTARLFRPQPIEVTAPAPASTSPGTSAALPFRIGNGGAGVRLTLTAVESSTGTVLPVDPPSLDLPAGGQGTAIVRLAVPREAGGRRLQVMLTAYADDGETGNYATGAITVAPSR